MLDIASYRRVQKPNRQRNIGYIGNAEGSPIAKIIKEDAGVYKASGSSFYK